ncbi:MAG: ABC transporter substrate-binding protein [Minwuia sp.]|uniref:ABC transporter substrate-binding protein n=1 Tax=Minwuia sp. TaxID=2493630 RepID=UPI003A87E651
MTGRRSIRNLLIAAGIALASLGTGEASAACEVDRPVVIAGLNWDSNAFHAALAARILKDGFGCRVEIATGSTRPLFRMLMRGEIDVMMEVWKDNLPGLWQRSQSDGSVVELGINYPDAIQGWFVPRYAVEGDDAPAAGLTAVADLPRYKQVFADPENRRKGRFYNCMLGWGCEAINTAKLYAYGLNAHYNNFRPVSGDALMRAISELYARQEPFLTYHWGPTWVLGAYDLVMLEEPPYDPDVWAKLGRSRKPEAATAYPVSEISIAVNRGFRKAAPEISAFLGLYRTSNRLTSEALAVMHRQGKAPQEAALWFLRQKPDVWQAWLPADIAAKVAASAGGDEG